eukprot:scaffold1279_cov306-Prasinococcus_capsulatus_cf.AAC.8
MDKDEVRAARVSGRDQPGQLVPHRTLPVDAETTPLNGPHCALVTDLRQPGQGRSGRAIHVRRRGHRHDGLRKRQGTRPRPSAMPVAGCGLQLSPRNSCVQVFVSDKWAACAPYIAISESTSPAADESAG